MNNIKKNILFTVYCLLITVHCISQCGNNLVPNSSFEQLSNCVSGNVNDAIGWKNPTTATPNLYNLCDTFTPTLWINVGQVPHSGDGMVGIFCMQLPFKNAREYVQAKLLSPLILGKKYCISFYVNLDNWSKYALSGMGAYLSDNAITLSSGPPYNFTYTPQVQNPKGHVLNDTVNWVEISGCFIAQGGEQYITLGNFKTDNDCDTLQYTNLPLNPGVGANYAYYFLDDVSVTQCTDTTALDIPNVFTPNDDGVNDTFEISASNVSSITYSIYNRWGVSVISYQLSVISKPQTTFTLWDGATTAGISCPTGVYYYVVLAKDNEGKGVEKKGFIQLIR